MVTQHLEVWLKTRLEILHGHADFVARVFSSKLLVLLEIIAASGASNHFKGTHIWSKHKHKTVLKNKFSCSMIFSTDASLSFQSS